MMNDAQKAQEIGKLAADTCDYPLTTNALHQIAALLWPTSRSLHDPFVRAYMSEICDDAA